MPFIRYFDLVVLLVALPIFILGDLPLAGYGVGAGAWLVQRTAQVLLDRRAAASDDPRVTVGVLAGSMIGRGWMVALAVFAIGLAAGDDAGLAAAVLVIALFTVYFTMKMILRPFDAHPPTHGGLQS